MFLSRQLYNGCTGPIAFKFAVCFESHSAFAKVRPCGVSLHVRTCTPLCFISGTAGPIVFNFGVRLGRDLIDKIFNK